MSFPSQLWLSWQLTPAESSAGCECVADREVLVVLLLAAHLALLVLSFKCFQVLDSLLM